MLPGCLSLIGENMLQIRDVCFLHRTGMIAWISQGLEKVVPQLELKSKDSAAEQQVFHSSDMNTCGERAFICPFYTGGKAFLVLCAKLCLDFSLKLNI